MNKEQFIQKINDYDNQELFIVLDDLTDGYLSKVIDTELNEANAEDRKYILSQLKLNRKKQVKYADLIAQD